MTDEHPARREPVPARAALRWPDHPPAIGAADELAEGGHDKAGAPARPHRRGPNAERAANGLWPTTPTYAGPIRDREVIDSELRLLAAVRRSVREHGAPQPTDGTMDEPLDARGELTGG